MLFAGSSPQTSAGVLRKGGGMLGNKRNPLTVVQVCTAVHHYRKGTNPIQSLFYGTKALTGWEVAAQTTTPTHAQR